MSLLGLPHVAEVYPLNLVGSRQVHTAAPLDTLWLCFIQPADRRDIYIEPEVRANQWVGYGEPEPLIATGWKLKVYYVNWDGTKGSYYGEFQVTDPDNYTGMPDPMGMTTGPHHQELKLMKLESRNTYGS